MDELSWYGCSKNSKEFQKSKLFYLINGDLDQITELEEVVEKLKSHI